MQRQATEEQRNAAWANYYAQQAAMLQQQPQQFRRPPPTFYQPPPTKPNVPVQSTNVMNHPQYQKYLLHYQQQILQQQQQQQWRQPRISIHGQENDEHGHAQNGFISYETCVLYARAKWMY